MEKAGGTSSSMTGVTNPTAAEASGSKEQQHRRRQQQQQQQQTTAPETWRPQLRAPPCAEDGVPDGVWQAEAGWAPASSAADYTGKGTPREQLVEHTVPVLGDKKEVAGVNALMAAQIAMEFRKVQTAVSEIENTRRQQSSDSQRADQNGTMWRTRRRKQLCPKTCVRLAERVPVESCEAQTALRESKSSRPYESPDSQKAGEGGTVGRAHRRKQLTPKTWDTQPMPMQHQQQHQQQQHQQQQASRQEGRRCSPHVEAESRMKGAPSAPSGNPRSNH